MKKNLETDRLLLREFEITDSYFILSLLNTPGWLEFIGDRGVKTVLDAKKYLETGPLYSYREHGYGLWALQLKHNGKCIGMCGLLKRSRFKYADIGFAILPNFAGKGYGFEAASATMTYATQVLNIPRIIAITKPENKASIKLLQKLGLHFDRTAEYPKNNFVSVFVPSQTIES
ncbi:GNAT family N-acetyltransferase [Spongiimicrobium salis]|uniref:GNAT family N-acetyltransferase n=1 Tax=Spongiimicrobium salis TaxID=1667022 RepID=UPI00374D6BBF